MNSVPPWVAYARQLEGIEATGEAPSSYDLAALWFVSGRNVVTAQNHQRLAFVLAVIRHSVRVTIARDFLDMAAKPSIIRLRGELRHKTALR